MPLPWSHAPWSVRYLARRTAGLSSLLAERVGVAMFPSNPPPGLQSLGWAAGYAAGTSDALEDPAAVAAR